ncbi:MAG: sodium-dependent bicarbonate transport family permease [Rhizobiaceae bacterium]|nr:sodium-dependent bicarbonate transport family permease [Rhizobiaceae bacterium]
MISTAAETLLSPIVLSFVLGVAAALARSDLSFPEAIAKGLSLYLLFAIGFKGGASIASHGIDGRLLATLLAGALLSLTLPFVAFALLRLLTKLTVVDAASIAAHYGSISIVTFVAATTLLAGQNVEAEGYMVAVAAAMEAPAILSALWIVARRSRGGEGMGADVWREILLNGSIVLLLGSFVIGWLTGERGLQEIAGLVVVPFKGILCLFLLDMGIVAGRGLRANGSVLTPGVILFGLGMPLVGATAGLAAGTVLGLSTGGVTLMMVLSASASYIAVPAAMRVALPEANPALSLGLALGITFPFNLILGIPLYLAAATLVAGGQ